MKTPFFVPLPDPVRESEATNPANKLQRINFDINNRINALMAKPGSENEDLTPILIDLIKELDPIKPIKGFTEPPEPEWIAVRGPGLYALIDNFLHPWCSQIIWIGEAEYVKGRVAEHLRLERMIFNSVRSVFIEHDEIRLLMERELIRYFKHHPESCHSDSILNKHIG